MTSQVERMEIRQIEMLKRQEESDRVGSEVIAQGNTNNLILWTALRSNGIDLPDPLEYRDDKEL